MLGQLTIKGPWTWAATGKHPMAKDYFQFGRNDALTGAFAAWIENGYRKLVSIKKKEAAFHSWRFWAPGKGKGSITCGIGRDSSDRMGRPYPFLIIGMGTIPGWEDHWELLPFIFDKTWGSMEYLASARLNDLKELEKEINQIKKPSIKEVPDISQLVYDDIKSLLNTIKKSAEDLIRDNELYAPVNDNPNNDALSLVMQWHRGLKLNLKTHPSIVLMGGRPEKSYIAVFNRSLNADDFVKLWTV